MKPFEILDLNSWTEVKLLEVKEGFRVWREGRVSIILIQYIDHYDDDDMEEEEVLWKCGLLRSNLVSTVVRGEPTKVLRGQGGRTRSVLC